MTDVTTDVVLECLIEECAEVIQAATKCLRFGLHHDEPGYGKNSTRLAEEIGDVLGVIDMLHAQRAYDDDEAGTKRWAKPGKIVAWHEQRGHLRRILTEEKT